MLCALPDQLLIGIVYTYDFKCLLVTFKTWMLVLKFHIWFPHDKIADSYFVSGYFLCILKRPWWFCPYLRDKHMLEALCFTNTITGLRSV